MKAKFNPFGVAAIALLMGSVALTSCDKNEGSLNGAGKTIVKLPQADEEIIIHALDYTPDIVDLVLLDVRRDAPNEGELNKAIVVTIKNDTSVVGAYNRKNHTNYEELPAAAYVVDAGNPYNGKEWTVTFNAGEHAKPILIKLDASKMDLSKQYAFGFTIADASGATIGSQRSALIQVGIKNQYDGVYSLTGTANHPTNATLIGPYGPDDFDLITAGEKSIQLGSNHPWSAASGSGLPAGYEPIYTIDAATNAVTVTNKAVVAEPIAGTTNYYDPATRTIYAAWQYAGSGGYRQFWDTLVYKGPR